MNHIFSEVKRPDLGYQVSLECVLEMLRYHAVLSALFMSTFKKHLADKARDSCPFRAMVDLSNKNLAHQK
jgi:hypothetical protein